MLSDFLKFIKISGHDSNNVIIFSLLLTSDSSLSENYLNFRKAGHHLHGRCDP